MKSETASRQSNEIFVLKGEGGGIGGREENRPKIGERHDNMILKVQVLSSDILLYLLRRLMKTIGHPQTCVYPNVCLGIAHVCGKAPLSGQGVWQIHNVSAPFAPNCPEIVCAN